MKKTLLALAATLILGACATGYQKDGFTGGYEETWLARDSVRIHYRGNAFTRSQSVVDFSLLRVAEIGVEKGYPFFMLVSEGTSTKTVTTPTQYQANTFGNTTTINQTGGHTFTKPRASNQAIFFVNRPEVVGTVVYESQFVCQSIKDKYKLKEAKC